MLAVHPRSQGFDWGAAMPLPAHRALTGEQWHRFDVDGFVVIEDLVDDTTLAEVRDATDVFCAEADAFLASMPDERLFIAEKGAITFAPQIALRSGVLRRFVASPSITAVVHDLVGPDARLYHDQAVYKASAKPRRFPWHQDNGYAFVTPEHYLTVWVALTDVPVEAGCVWAAPGLHRLGTLTHEYAEPLGYQLFEEPPVEPVAAPIRAGSAVVFSSLTPHLTGPNVSGGMRKAYILQYVGPHARRFAHSADDEGTPIADDQRYPWVLRGGVPFDGTSHDEDQLHAP
jgi:ectoine hydroxylase-related dioxygenase (phytanoyl-CoA dioxygenase family)